MKHETEFEPIKALKEVLQGHNGQPYALKLHEGSLSTRFSQHPFYDLEIRKGNGKSDNVRFLLNSKKNPEEKSVFFIDGNSGKAQYYILKKRTEKLQNGVDFTKEPFRLWSDFETKDVDGEPVPQTAGTEQSMTLTLPAGTYYFGMQSVDDAPYNSRISNIVEVKVV